MRDDPSEKSLQLLTELKRQIMIKVLAQSLKRDLQRLKKVKYLNVTATKRIKQEGWLDLPLFESLLFNQKLSCKIIPLSEGRKLKNAKG
jgi:hypothetical protein